jgi:hypothetical protein
MNTGIVILVVLLAIGGVWGTVVLRALLRRVLPRGERQSDRRIGELEVDYGQLEARFRQLEEEVGFLRALHGPDQLTELAAPTDRERDESR